MRLSYFVAIIGLLLFAVLNGCNAKDGRPDDLPKLNPCAITVTQGGQPLEGAVVTFKSKDASVKYSTSSGTTDASGIAQINTYGFPGVPTGNYKVTVKKFIAEGGKETTDGSGVTNTSGAKEYSLVAAQFTKENSTTLEIEIISQKNEQTFDIGEPVKDFIGYSP